ncbi:MAG: YdbL family protein [Novosphingobium sp.]
MALAALGLAAPALAQRDPAYEAARAGGQVGEKMDGYLGLVGGGTPALRAIVDDLNIKRRAVYAQKAQAQHATIEEYAFTSGCLLIAQTDPGEKYQAPGGGWETRGSGAPRRDARCP